MVIPLVHLDQSRRLWSTFRMHCCPRDEGRVRGREGGREGGRERGRDEEGKIGKVYEGVGGNLELGSEIGVSVRELPCAVIKPVRLRIETYMLLPTSIYTYTNSMMTDIKPIIFHCKLTFDIYCASRSSRLILFLYKYLNQINFHLLN